MTQDNCGDASDEDPRICDQKRMTSFENGYARWGERLKKGWALHAASSNILESPTFDHTSSFSGGHYLFAKGEYLGRKKTVTATIDSPPVIQIANSRKRCQISFFKMSNSENASLLVIRENVTTSVQTIIKQISTVEQQFVNYVFDLEDFSSPKLEPFRVILTAAFDVKPNTWANPYIAVDDIAFSSGCLVLDSLPPVTLPGGITVTTAKPPIISNCSTVSCLSKANPKQTICLRVDQLCNLVEDCLKGEDEQSCLQCDFDHGNTCGWSNRPAQTSWRLAARAKDSEGKLPKEDADSNPLGGFIWHTSATFSATAIMRSAPLNSATSPYCKLEFSFNIPQGTALKVSRISATGSTQVLSSTGSFYSSEWKVQRIDIGAQASGFSLQVESKTSSKNTFVAVDSIKLLECIPDTPPPTTPKPISIVGSVSCTFESDLCGWTVANNEKGFRSNWLRVGNRSNVEPGTDHTCLQQPRPKQCGTWLSTQAKTDEKREEDFLQTVYPLKANTTYCFSFWYYFYGSSGKNNRLGVYLTKGDKLSADKLNSQWLISKPRARKWLFQHLELQSSNSAASYILVKARASINAVIGVDDLQLTEGNCPTSPFSCDFEEKCDWGGGEGWTVGSSSLGDHTTRTANGHFLVDSAGVGKKSVMYKDLFTLPFYKNGNWGLLETFCLKLYYRFSANSFGINNDNSSLVQVTVNQKGGSMRNEVHNVTIIDAFNDGKMNLWTPYMLNFIGERTTVVSIAGILGNANTAINIDDISFKPEACQADGNCNFENGKHLKK